MASSVGWDQQAEVAVGLRSPGGRPVRRVGQSRATYWWACASRTCANCALPLDHSFSRRRSFRFPFAPAVRFVFAVRARIGVWFGIAWCDIVAVRIDRVWLAGEEG